jgi:anti-anti-sigma factor
VSPEFHIEVERQDGAARVRPVGDLDLATADRLDARLRELRAAGVRRVVLDLRALDFMDSSGLSLTLRWSLASQEDGLDFALVPGGRPIRRLFQLSGMEPRLPFLEPEA